MSESLFPLRVESSLPKAIRRLADLAENFWFSWHRPTRQLFYLLDHELWWQVGRNPHVFLRYVDQRLLDDAAVNETFLGAYRKVIAEFDAYLDQGLNGYAEAGLDHDDQIAYFCAEFGYHESFPIYSGGLGILAGDHCKTASDMRLPFVGVGLLYRQGYFNQRIDRAGNQIAEYPYLEAIDTPVHTARDEAGNELIVHCQFPGREVAAKVWRAAVGRVPVLLLDTDIPENNAADREITRVLYGGDREQRMKQEIILGIGGVRALRAAGMAPKVWHMNEGHAAFLVLERIREFVQQGLSFSAALEACAANTVFTTHTPVSAGHDVFTPELVLEYFHEGLAGLGMSEMEFLALGGSHSSKDGFNMTKLALHGAKAVNAVSRIHGQVSSQICADNWPEIPPAENPVGFVTNGVHVPTFLEEDWAELLEQHVGPAWASQLDHEELAEKIEVIPDGRFWYVNQRVKSNMLVALRTRLERQFAANRVSDSHSRRLLRHLDPEDPNVLTVGFARRFATYKRATLLFTDRDWLQHIINQEDRPIVFIFAGKAHPSDEPGQRLLQEIHNISNSPEFAGKVILAGGYDMGLGRLLTAGVDVWLNTPIAPLEASGTSGMKAAINGTVNLSVLDGWWAEAYDGTNGWAIPPAAYDSDEERDREDARTLYEVLQDEVIPRYYDIGARQGYSAEWVHTCKRSMATVLRDFNTRRFLRDYTLGFYGPAAERWRKFGADGHRAATELAAWKERVRAAWPKVELHAGGERPARIRVDQSLSLDVNVDLGGLEASDVRVECAVLREVCSSLPEPKKSFADYGLIEDGVRHIDDDAVFVAPFEVAESGSGRARYRLDVKLPWSGAMRYEIRAVPTHSGLAHPYEMGLMRRL